MKPILSECLSLDEGEATECAIDILRHRLGKKCVVRYRLRPVNSKPGRSSPRSLVGKVYRDDRGRQALSAMRGLWELGFGEGAGDGIRIPKPLAHIPEGQLLLMEDAPGRPVAAIEGARIEPAIQAAGRALAKLHSCPLQVPARYSVEDEGENLTRWVAAASQIRPEIRAVLEDARIKARDTLNRCRNFELTLIHRDFHDQQLLVDGPHLILVDLDTLCLSDPAIDIGNFLAHVRLASLQRPASVERPEAAFLAAYGHRLPQEFSARVEAYTGAALLRLACVYALRPYRSHLAKRLLGYLT
jgi:hypothetical protein